jgi:Protein of unknown function (DUF3618)
MTDSIDARVSAARSSLESTLDQLDDKFNVPKQAEKLATKAKTSYSDNPVPWIIGATAAAIVVAGTIAWAILSDD